MISSDYPAADCQVADIQRRAARDRMDITDIV